MLYFGMVKDALVKTNPYLKKASMRQKLLLVAANSSTAVEGVRFIVSKVFLRKKNHSSESSEKHASIPEDTGRILKIQ